MKLNHLFDIFESFNTTFTKLEWLREDQNLVAYGQIEDQKIKLVLNPITYLEFSGINLIFSVFDEATNAYSEKLGTAKNSASKIIGAITNAFKAKVQEFDWDFIIAVVKDGEQSRASLYSAILQRIARELHYGTNRIDRDDFSIIGLGKRGNLETILSNLTF